jgi:hypothetical protein
LNEIIVLELNTKHEILLLLQSTVNNFPIRSSNSINIH